MQRALAAVHGAAATSAALESRRAWVRASGARSVHAIAVGKAAGAMLEGAFAALTESGSPLERALLITKRGHASAAIAHRPGVELIEASHPIPDARSLAAGERMLEFATALPADVLPLLLISGGASSLVEALRPGVSLDALQELNRRALAEGMPIGALNERRARLSRLKAAGLTARLAGRPALALFISDVPDDDPAVIGSGLAAPLPGDCIERHIVARIEDAMAAAAAAATAFGLRVTVGTRRFDAEAVDLAPRLVHELQSGADDVRIWGGESRVALPRQPGRGGRNQHLALAVALELAGAPHDALLAIGTDGDDGPTEDAGACVDGGTALRIEDAGMDGRAALAAADSGTALAAAGDLLCIGPTGTNVGDLVIACRGGDRVAAAGARCLGGERPSMV